MHISHLSYQHGEKSPYFFKELSFQLETGKIHALHGKNGVGKTVLLNLLIGNIPPQAIITGKISKPNNACLVNQRFDQMIADSFSFEENLQFAQMGRYPKLFTRLTQQKKIFHLLDKYHIDMSQQVATLSGGQRQILALLMVLQKRKDLLLLDEPTATLDEENAHMVFDFLTSLADEQTTTILVVCHDKDLSRRYTTGKQLELSVKPCGLRDLLEIPSSALK